MHDYYYRITPALMVTSGGTRSALLPAVFVNKFTQKRDASGDIVPRPGLSISSGKFIGVQNQAGGEMAELEFFTKLGMCTDYM